MLDANGKVYGIDSVSEEPVLRWDDNLQNPDNSLQVMDKKNETILFIPVTDLYAEQIKTIQKCNPPKSDNGKPEKERGISIGKGDPTEVITNRIKEILPNGQLLLDIIVAKNLNTQCLYIEGVNYNPDALLLFEQTRCNTRELQDEITSTVSPSPDIEIFIQRVYKQVGAIIGNYKDISQLIDILDIQTISSNKENQK